VNKHRKQLRKVKANKPGKPLDYAKIARSMGATHEVIPPGVSPMAAYMRSKSERSGKPKK
jgi:hypothetical protein